MASNFEIPPKLPLAEQRGQTFVQLVELMQRLLAPDGCPWDREQNFSSLRRYVLEEACEVIDAIEGGDRDDLVEELGDLALQVVFLSELGRREGAFGPDDAVRAVCDKLVRRHPHVFGSLEVSGSEEVLRNWEAIKADEKRDRGLLDGVPHSLPALHRAQRMSEKVSRVGFDWPNPQGSRAKVGEELAELDEAITGGDAERIEHELGDLLFALVNLARHQKVDAETALRKGADRFRARFDHVERRVRAKHGGWPNSQDGKPSRGLALEELDGYWEEAKREAR
jgi:tetrapyrrole methylase family protein/MazG family protein/ATP diphosphatase